MQSLVIVFLLVIAAVVSILLGQLVPRISTNYISLLVGIILFTLPLPRLNLAHFEADIFLGIVIAPLLFFEGQATRINTISRSFRQILQMTISLVLLCFVVAGLGVWGIGDVSLPMAFILGAISTPTDATALSSVTEGLRFPKKPGAQLRLESLFNDASGIILLNMALLWSVNGAVNVPLTFVQFLWSAGGGVFFGLVLGWIVIIFRQSLLRSALNALNAQELVYLLAPLVIYFGAELIHVSGIIAVVSAGLLHNAEMQRSRLINPPQIHFGLDLVNLVTEVFNCVVFTVLGYLIADVVVNAKSPAQIGQGLLIGVVLYGAGLIIRYAYQRLRMHADHHFAAIFALGGVHGAVTLALAFYVASIHVSDSLFTLVMLATTVLILLSLLVPTVVFRFILPKDSSEAEIRQEINKLREDMSAQAIAMVQKMYLPSGVKKAVIFELNTQKQSTSMKDFIKAWRKEARYPEFSGAEKELEMRAYMAAFAQERTYLDTISQSEVKYQRYVYDLYNEILLAESLIVGPNVFEGDE